jgi:FixJ family two-component response regulator
MQSYLQREMIAALLQNLPPLPPPFPDAVVCVVDGDEAVRSRLKRLFTAARLTVETFASAVEYLGRTPHPGPVCVVSAMLMPGLDGLEFQNILAGRSERLVFLTGHGDVPMCARAMKAGAVDFLTKPVDEETLLSAVTRALSLAREASRTRAEQAAARAVLEALTPRESEVMECVVAGMLNKQIAAKLGVAEKTVKIHRGRVMRKTRSLSVPDLLRLFIRAGDEVHRVG